MLEEKKENHNNKINVCQIHNGIGPLVATFLSHTFNGLINGLP